MWSYSVQSVSIFCPIHQTATETMDRICVHAFYEEVISIALCKLILCDVSKMWHVKHQGCKVGWRYCNLRRWRGRGPASYVSDRQVASSWPCRARHVQNVQTFSARALGFSCFAFFTSEFEPSLSPGLYTLHELFGAGSPHSLHWKPRQICGNTETARISKNQKERINYSMY